VSNDLLDGVKRDKAFVTSHATKGARERWIVDRWLAAAGRSTASVADGDDPPDFVVAGCGVEVVEVLEYAGDVDPRHLRRRGDEYKERVQLAEEGVIGIRQLPSLEEVRVGGHRWIFAEVRKKSEKYDATHAAHWTLLVYANFSWTDHVQWDVLTLNVSEIGPPFAAIEVVFDEADGPHVRRVFERPPSS
jgi:hypothetical protein